MAYTPLVLIVDDDSTMRQYLSEICRRLKCQVDEVEDGNAAIQKLNERQYELIVCDIRMPKVGGIEVLKHAKELHPQTEVIMITAYATVETAVEAMKGGAFDFLQKDYSLDHTEMIIKKALERYRLIHENQSLKKEIDGLFGFHNIVGKSRQMQSVFETLNMVADSDATVFIQGPSGTGKELIAKALHYNSRRKNMPFIKTNCAALPEGLVESELFGHEKGAFTGAIKTRKGRFEAANSGTLLLDEVSEMKPSLQAKLLRVLQEQEFEKVGDIVPIKVDVRIIATTNRDIKEAIKEGEFREDLYYRLNVIPLYIPPLRERKKDIPLLVDHFIEKCNHEHDREVEGIDAAALNLLMRLDWPGNVRELENKVERAVIMCKGKALETRHFLFEEEGFDEIAHTHSEDTLQTLREHEKQIILRTLKESDLNRTRAAEILDISVRTLRNKLNEYKDRGELDPMFIKNDN